ncbi:transcriptional activator GLI3-like isoform X1 [Vespula squamosa]|uniref:Transcriptional activator GLI3-like isoform X1 n=1 Tax=Vespula squamosa TaxID=30214 RepID=A0ABD1ZT10_VESSQ
MELHTPERESRSLAEALPCSPPMSDTMLYPWNWSEEARNVNLSPGSSCSSPEYRENNVVPARAGSRSRSGVSESHRRGRPRADALSNLMKQGSTSPSSIKCTYCSRVFPREKSLQAHLRTHTERYKMSREREDRTPTGKNERKKKTWKSTAENHKRVKSRKGLMMDAAGEQENLNCKLQNQRFYCGESQDSQEESQDEDPTEACTVLQTSEDEDLSTLKLAISPLRRPLDRLQPKKRWLREACLEQQLAKPLNWDAKINSMSTTCKTNDKPNTYELSTSCSNLQWSISDSSYSAVSNETTLKKLETEHNTVSYNSNQADWNIQTCKESSKIIIPQEIKEVTNVTDTATETIWDSLQDSNTSLQSNLKSLETTIAQEIKNINTEVTTEYWDVGGNSDASDTILVQRPPLNTKIIRNEIPLEDTLVSSYNIQNETRPTVLMLAGSSGSNLTVKEVNSKAALIDASKKDVKVVIKQEDSVTKLPLPEDNKKWLGALALMELAKTQEETAKVLDIKVEKDDQFIHPTLNYNHL